MKIFPAIDLIGGQAVRLYKGDYEQVKVYDRDAVSVAKRFAEDGARYLHLVDLDGAKNGATDNFSVIEKIVAATGMFCEVGGGIRTMESIATYLNSGAGRVILGTAAIKDPELLSDAISKYGERICVGVDTKNGKVAVKGWLEFTDTDGLDFCKELSASGVKSVIYTDISKDGTMSGTNLEIYEELAKIEALNVTASGGVCTLEEILKLKSFGIHSVILGKALYEGAINLKDVIQAVGIDQ